MYPLVGAVSIELIFTCTSSVKYYLFVRSQLLICYRFVVNFRYQMTQYQNAAQTRLLHHSHLRMYVALAWVLCSVFKCISKQNVHKIISDADFFIMYSGIELA